MMLKRVLASLVIFAAACTGEELPPVPDKPAADTTAPVISNLKVDKARAAKGTAITVSLSVDEELKRLVVLVAGKTAECTAEGNDYTCTHTLLGDESPGAQVVEARAYDLAGNVGTAKTEFTLDYKGPAISVTNAPPPLSNLETATIAFTADDEGVTFRCATNGAPATECTSPYTTPALPEGRQVVVITATDDLGNEASARVEFTTDRTAPTTTLLRGIPALTREETHSVTFRSNDLQARFECRIDAESFTTCTSPYEVAGYAEGEHTFEIRAVDEVGNTEAAPISIAFISDRTAPKTQIEALADTGAKDRTINFTIDEANSVATCLLDGSPYEPCTSPIELTGLPDGEHAFDVRATDEAGNVEANFASVAFVVDTTGPSTSIFSGPISYSSNTSALIQFSSNEGGSTFACSFNGSPLTACTSPHSETGLADGPHRFEVIATDKYGNADPTPASVGWTVDTIAPVASFIDTVPPLVLRPEVTVTFEANETSTFECSLDGGPFVNCASPHTITELTDNVNTGEPMHVFAVRAKDRANNIGDPVQVEFDVNLSFPTPGVVRLLGPDPSKSSNTTPSFFWEGSHADSYDFEISTDATFADASKTVVSLVDTNDDFYTPTEPLPVGKYFVRIRGKNITGYGEYSDCGMVEIVAGSTAASWVKLERTPTASDMRGVTCKSPSDCIYVGASGTILRTKDGGRTLVPSASPVTTTLNNVEYFGDSTVIAVGASGVILRSNNDGITWSRITKNSAGATLPTSDFRALHFKDGVGFAGGGSGNMFRSDDAGLTWVAVTKPSTSATQQAVWVLSTTPTVTALTLDWNGEVRRTTDGGATWSGAIKLTGTGWGFSLSFVDELTGFASGDIGKIFRTTDGGLTWKAPATNNPHTTGNIEAVIALDENTAVFAQSVSTSTTAVYSNIRAVVFNETDAVWAEGTRTDGGPVRGVPVYGLVGFGSSGYAVGAGGSIYEVNATPSGPAYGLIEGVNDPVLATSTGEVRAINFPTPTTGFVVGTSGLVMKSTDAGQKFTGIIPDSANSSRTYSAVQFIDEDTGWIAGDSGTIMSTVDGGATWTKLTTPSTSPTLRSMHVRSDMLGYVVGSSGAIWKLDGAGNFVVAGPVTGQTSTSWRTVAVQSENEVYVAGQAISRLAVWDGAAWTVETVPDPEFAGPWLISMAVPAPGVLIVGTDEGVIYRRTGGPTGATWATVVDTFDSTDFIGLHFVDELHGWAVGSSGIILSTIDGGVTWTRDTSFTTSVTLSAVHAFSPTDVLIGGTSRQLWRNPAFSR